VLGDGPDAEGSANHAIEAGGQRWTGRPSPQQGHQVVDQGADASEVEAGFGDLAGLEATGGAQPRQANLPVRPDAHMAQRHIAVGQAGVVGEGVQGGDPAGEVSQQQQALVEGEVDPPVLHRRRQLDEVKAIKPGRHHKRDTVDDAVAEVGGQLGMALADEAIAAGLELGEVAGVEAAIDLEKKGPAKSGVGRLVPIRNSGAAEVVEQGEVAKSGHVLV